MFLKRLYIHNYKSFYHTEIELDKLNIFVGENNVGKSNLIDVLEFYDLVSKKTLIDAIKEKGGFEKIFNYHHKDSDVVIEVELEKDNIITKVRYRVQQNLKSILSVIVYDKKTMTVIQAGGQRNNKEKNKIIDFRWNNKDIDINTKIRFSYNAFDITHILNGNLSNIYYFNAQTIRESHKNSEDTILLKDGSNLGKILYDLKINNPIKFETISNSLMGIVKEIEGIDVQKIYGNYPIGFIEKGKDEPISINQVSDGTINLIATITAINQNTDKKLLAFEEPERHLHLKAIDYLLDAFRNSDKQIIITTHSTEMLKCANLDEIIFLYRDSDGDTQAIRADKIEGLKDKLKNLAYERDLTLDELISDGIIGDFE